MQFTELFAIIECNHHFMVNPWKWILSERIPTILNFKAEQREKKKLKIDARILHFNPTQILRYNVCCLLWKLDAKKLANQ